MQPILKISFLSMALFVAIGCGESKKEKDGNLNEKKAQLEKLKADQTKLSTQITALEKEIAKTDTAAGVQEKPKLVSLETIATTDFAHYIELQGKITAEDISFITPRGQGGVVKQLFVKKGDVLHKGQLLMQLDDVIQKQQVVAARQGLETIKSQLAYAKDIAQRQQNLWDQKIGTEVQLLTAKNNVNNIQTQLAAAEENVKTAQEQQNTATVYSDVNGIANDVTIKVGEIFSPATANSLGIGVVNTSSLKATTTIPENYLGSVKKGTPVVVQVVDLNKSINTNISFISAAIDPLTRGFVMDAKLAADPSLKPNQTALIKIKDYNASQSITVPVNTLQTDEKGKFVMIAVQEGDKLRARKRQVFPGQFYGDRLEIKSGLNAGEKVITEGFQSVYDGQLLSIK